MSEYKKPVIGERHPDGRAWTDCKKGEVEMIVALPFLQWATQQMTDSGDAEATGREVTNFVLDELTPIGREVLAASLATLGMSAAMLAQMIAQVVYQDRAKAARHN